MQNHEIQYLAEVLERHKTRLGGWSSLAKAIKEANRAYQRPVIDRRTLASLCDEDSGKVQLRIDQILAIDHWLDLQNENVLLARHRCLIDSVRESYNVNFLVAVKRSEAMKTDVVSRSDLGAITRLLRTPLNRLHVGIWDIKSSESKWILDVRILNAANVAIASPVASDASHILMSRMIGTMADQHVDVESLPFYIVAAKRDNPGDRHFVRSRSEMASTPDSWLLPEDPEKRALVVNGKWYVSNAREDYALLLAQRNADNGHVQMVLCGLTGQGTYQLARIIQSGQPLQTMPPLQTGQAHPPILAVIYRLTPGEGNSGNGPGDHPAIESNPVDSPVFLRHEAGTWHFPG